MSSEDFSKFQNMAQNDSNRPKPRAFSPYAVDSVEDGSGGQELSSFKGSYQNPAYENCGDLSHQYEDPTRLLEVQSINRGARRKRNELYEPTELRKPTEPEEEGVDYNEADIGGDSLLSRLILFLILIVSLVSLLMVVLIILGKVGPSCSCKKNSAQEVPSGQEVKGGAPSSRSEVGLSVLPPDISSLEDKIDQLKANISMIKKFMITLQHDLHNTRGNLNETRDKVSETKDGLLQIKSGMQDSIDKISNISQQLDKSVSVVNESFHHELVSLETTFITKLNNTVQSLSDADSSLKSSLDVINSSLTSHIQRISKLQGPIGSPGFNGSKGVPGAPGNQGPMGNTGAQGPPGQQGDAGDPGRNGTDGVDGQKGDLGQQGDKGPQGPVGPAGPSGPTGPQGPPGAGNFSQCAYTAIEESVTATGFQTRSVMLIEPDGKKILGVSCSTNQAAEYNLDIEELTTSSFAGKYRYRCTCKGLSKLFTDSTNSVKCILHYWECPLTT